MRSALEQASGKFVTLLSLLLLVCVGCTERPAPPATGLDGQLEQAQKNGKLVMLELGSVGCIPCENMKPVMEKLKQNYGNRLEVIFIDVKQERQIATRYKVYTIPVQVFIDTSGAEFHRHLGFYPYEEIVPVLKSRGL